GSQFAGAQFKGAILLGADLRNTGLRGANFAAAVLRDAPMDNAQVDGADFRGALGLNAAQVCSTRGWNSARFDADVLLAVLTQCGITKYKSIIENGPHQWVGQDKRSEGSLFLFDFASFSAQRSSPNSLMSAGPSASGVAARPCTNSRICSTMSGFASVVMSPV